MCSRLPVTVLLNLAFTLAYASLLAPAGVAVAQTVSTLPLSQPIFADGIRCDPDGSIIAVGGYRETKVYRISPDGQVSVLADGFAGPTHSARDASGRLFVTNYSDAGSVSVLEPGSTAPERFATVPQGVAGIAIAPDGNLYVSIYGDAQGSGDAIYRIDAASGEAEVFVQGPKIKAPIGIAFAPDGTLYAGNSRSGEVQRIDRQGNVSLLAQLPAGEGFFANGHLVYGNGRLYASGNHHHRVYEVSLEGTVRVLAGNGEPGLVDGPVAESRVTLPNGIALSPDGTRLYVMTGGPNLRTSLRVIDLR